MDQYPDVQAQTEIRNGHTYVSTQGGWKKLLDENDRQRDRDVIEADMLAKRSSILADHPEYEAWQVEEALGTYASNYRAWKQRTEDLEQQRHP